MFTVFKLIKKLLHYLNANEAIENITLSITFALFYSFIPFNPIFHPILFFLVIILNGNLLFFLFLIPFFISVSSTVFPFLHIIGNTILSSEFLEPIFKTIYKIPFVNFLNWNNTVSLGGYFVIILFSYPVYKLTYKLIQGYRNKFLPSFKKSKISKLFKLPTWFGGN